MTDPEAKDAKDEHQMNVIKARRIIVDSINDHLISIVSSRKTPKEMYDALSRLFEGKNINKKMNLRNALKSMKMAKGESVRDYFSRIHQLKE